MLDYACLQTFDFLLWKYLRICVNLIYVVQRDKQDVVVLL